MNRFARASGVTAVLAFSALVTGCAHEGLNTVVGNNGTATLVLTETISPVVYASADVLDGITPAKLASEAAKAHLPGEDSVKVYTDSEGWKGIEVLCSFHSLSALNAAEVALGSKTTGTGMFTSFSITQSGSQWALDAKVDVPGITDLITITSGKSKKSESRGVTRADLAQIGMKISASFQLPGQIVSDNATSVKGSVMTWDLLSQVYTLHAITSTAPSSGTTTTSVPASGTTTSAALTTTSTSAVTTTTSAAGTTTSTTSTG